MNIEEFKKTLKERLAKRLETESFDEMTMGGSKLRFDMAMAIDGYPFELPDGANEKDYEALLTNSQYMSGKYDAIIEEVYSKAYDES